MPKTDQATLSLYRSRRDFRKTAEPAAGDASVQLNKSGNPIFVVQQHDAKSRHWDFRVEVDGVLKSWAVPKGPSTDPRDKRLAVATEDHPLRYADFEGNIPEGQYGAGSVIVWDAGPYKNLTKSDAGEEVPLDRALQQGKAVLWLEGKKLQGGYTLVHSQLRGDSKNWLLIKVNDEWADARRRPTRTQPRSVLSGRTMDEVAEQNE